MSDQLKLPDDLHELPVMFVVEGSPAWDALLRMCRHKLEPGAMFPVTDKELVSLRRDCLRVNLIDFSKSA